MLWEVSTNSGRGMGNGELMYSRHRRQNSMYKGNESTSVQGVKYWVLETGKSRVKQSGRLLTTVPFISIAIFQILRCVNLAWFLPPPRIIAESFRETGKPMVHSYHVAEPVFNSSPNPAATSPGYFTHHHSQAPKAFWEKCLSERLHPVASLSKLKSQLKD